MMKQIQCPNCGRETSDDFCVWCNYPLSSGTSKKVKLTNLRHIKEETSANPDKLRGRLRSTALVLALVMGVFWILGSSACIFGSDDMTMMDQDLVEGIIFILMPSLFIFSGLVIAWKWELIGGMFLMCTPIAANITWSILGKTSSLFETILFSFVLFYPFTIVCGLLFCWSWQRGRRRKN